MENFLSSSSAVLRPADSFVQTLENLVRQVDDVEQLYSEAAESGRQQNVLAECSAQEIGLTMRRIQKEIQASTPLDASLFVLCS